MISSSAVSVLFCFLYFTESAIIVMMSAMMRTMSTPRMIVSVRFSIMKSHTVVAFSIAYMVITPSLFPLFYHEKVFLSMH